MRTIMWFRRDLRTHDNTALIAALTESEAVIPVYILDDQLLRSPRLRGARIAWMLDALRQFDAELRERGSRLIVRRGHGTRGIAAELLRLCRETESGAVFFNRDYSSYAVKRDTRVNEVLSAEGIAVRGFKDLVLHESGEVRSDGFYQVFGAYKRAWLALPKPAELAESPRMDRLRVPESVQSIEIPTAAELGSTPAPQPIAVPGEKPACDRLEHFTRKAIYSYKEARNTPAIDGTSILSPYIRWGMLSPRTVYWAAITARDAVSGRATESRARENVDTWIGELAWREFYYQVLANRTDSVRNNFRPVYNAIQWENTADHLKAWTEGRTGFPIVDAAMRQMHTTGWMHNRCRMIVGSFLCKDLLIDWRKGEEVFMQHLFDGDVANNVGGWQWVAGTGTDAQPFYRIFNPVLQSKKFDPHGEYIRRWVPELRDVPDKYVHAPETMTTEQQTRYNVRIGRDYPAPLVEHAVQRDRALAMYGASRAAQKTEQRGEA